MSGLSNNISLVSKFQVAPEKFNKTSKTSLKKLAGRPSMQISVSVPVVEKYQLDVHYTHGLFVEEKKAKSRKVFSFSYHLQNN